MMRSRLTKLCAAVTLATASLAMPVMIQSASAATPTCNDPGTRVPIILVHGLNGSEADFTAHANGAEDLVKRLGTIPNVFTDMFDYSSVADQWVKNDGIGQALADRIGCLAAKSKAAGGIGKVVIVAHSMGGLAAREAMSLNYTATNAPVGPSVGLLVTVATPNTGSWSDALFHNVRSVRGGISLSELTWLAQGICGGIGVYTGPKRPGICGILQGSTSNAGTAMIPGSDELAKLPPPPSDLPVDAVAGQLTVTTTLFGVHKTYTVFRSGELGDILVKTDSALAYGSGAGRQSFVQPCTLSVSQVWNGQGWNGCTHGGLLYDPTVGQTITSWVQGWLAAHSPRTQVVQYSPVDANGLPVSGLNVVDGGTADSCLAGSDAVGNAYRCFAGNGVYDPCWRDLADPSSTAVLCQEHPWDPQTTRLVLSQGTLEGFAQPPSPIDLDNPWGVQLATGEFCLAVQGSHDADQGRVVDYSCGSGSQVLLRGVDRSQPQWSFDSASYNSATAQYSPGPKVEVAKAWYAIQEGTAEGALTPALAPFAGTWKVHAGNLTINMDGSATMGYIVYAGVGSTSPPTFPTLDLQLLATSPNSAMATVTSTTSPNVAVGATMTLTLASPGLAIAGPPEVPQVFCDQSHFDQGDCGA